MLIFDVETRHPAYKGCGESIIVVGRNVLDVVNLSDVLTDMVDAFDPRVKDKRLLRSERDQAKKALQCASNC